MLPALDHPVDDIGTGGVHQAGQLVERRLDLLDRGRWLHQSDEDDALAEGPFDEATAGSAELAEPTTVTGVGRIGPTEEIRDIVVAHTVTRDAVTRDAVTRGARTAVGVGGSVGCIGIGVGSQGVVVAARTSGPPLSQGRTRFGR